MTEKYNAMGILRKAAVGTLIVASIYGAEKLKPFDYLFPDKGKKVTDYTNSIEPQDVKNFPNEFSNLATLVLKELPANKSIEVASNFATQAPETVQVAISRNIYSSSNNNTKYAVIENIVLASNQKQNFYLTELGLNSLSVLDKAKVGLYGAVDLFGSKPKRPE